MRADLKLLEQYEHHAEDRLDCPILAVGGTDDECVNWDELTAWHTHTSQAFRSRLLPGGHFFMRESGPQLCALVARVLRPGRHRPPASPSAASGQAAVGADHPAR